MRQSKNGDVWYIGKSYYYRRVIWQPKRLGCGCTNNHAFRMAFNSRLIKLGLSAADRALILGHEVQTNEASYSLVDNRTLEEIKSRVTKGEAL